MKAFQLLACGVPGRFELRDLPDLHPGAGEVVAAPAQASDALKSAHAEYIQAYNAYISKVTSIGGSENPDEELRTNMRRDDTQQALNNYRAAYDKYITLLRQSNSK